VIERRLVKTFFFSGYGCAVPIFRVNLFVMPAEEKEVLAQLLPVIQTALVVPSNVGRYPIFDGSYDWHSCVHAHWYWLSKLLTHLIFCRATIRIARALGQPLANTYVAGAPPLLVFTTPNYSLFAHVGTVGDESLFHHKFTQTNMTQEIAMLKQNPSFERPYGLAWFLTLCTEVAGYVYQATTPPPQH